MVINTIASIWWQKYAQIFVLGHYRSSKVTVFLDLRFPKQIMTADKYSCIFSRQLSGHCLFTANHLKGEQNSGPDGKIQGACAISQSGLRTFAPKNSHEEIVLSLPRRKVMIYFCQKGKNIGGHRLRSGEYMPQQIPLI